MSKTTSPSAGRLYGLQRVCRVLDIPRSTIYAQEPRQAANVLPLQRARRGPKPKVSDADLLAAIRADLAASFFCVGIHAVKIGNRFAALQPIAQGLKAQPGGGARRRDRVQGSLRPPLASRKRCFGEAKTGLHVTPRSPSGLCHAKGGLSCKTVSR